MYTSSIVVSMTMSDILGVDLVFGLKFSDIRAAFTVQTSELTYH